jgi:hypothetical protein
MILGVGWDIWIIMAGMFSFLTAVFMFTTVMAAKRKSHWDIETQKAVLSAVRESYESQIARLSKEMTATNERLTDANHLVLSGQTKSDLTNVADQSTFLKAFRLRAADYVVDPKLIVVLTPFAEDEFETFAEIKSACERGGFKCVRGDEEYTPADILGHIIRLIVKARIVIANVDSRNPNVFYELGVAHALSKQTILISRNVTDVPFDIKGLRILTWKTHDDLRQGIQAHVLRALTSTGDV